MADDQIRPPVWIALFSSPQRGEDGVGVPDGVLEGPRTKVRLLRRAAGELIFDFLDALDLAGGRFAEESALPSAGLHEIPGDVAELGGEVLMNVKNVHDPSTASNDARALG